MICEKHDEVSRISIHIEDQLDQIEKKIAELDLLDQERVMQILQGCLGAIRDHADDIYYIARAAKEDGQNMEDALKSRNSQIECLDDEIEKLKAKIEELETEIEELQEQTNEKQD